MPVTLVTMILGAERGQCHVCLNYVYCRFCDETFPTFLLKKISIRVHSNCASILVQMYYVPTFLLKKIAFVCFHAEPYQMGHAEPTQRHT